MSGIEIQGGDARVVAVDFPSRTSVSKIIVVQYDGVLADLTVALYNHVSVLEGTEMSDTVGSETGPIPPDCYRVTPDLHGSNGKLIYFSDTATGGYGFIFYSQDRQPPGRQLGNVRKLYVKIAPQGSGAKKFALCIGGEQCVGQ
jgi:hypothetical protein